MASASAAVASSTRTLRVKAPDDGLEESYVLRGLEESEIPQWSAFCASVFAYKESPPPAAYFERHYKNDPDRQASYIRVACSSANNNEIVASCRIFVRKISTTKGSSLKAGGVGEVCTSAAHRKRGLSKELLQDCIRIMADEKFQVSLLHSAPPFFPVYQTVGYQSMPTKWTHIPIADQLGCYMVLFKVRPAQFPKDTAQLMKLHQAYSEKCFSGCIIRSKEYWEQYLAKELGDSLLIIEQGNTILAWMSLRERGSVIQVREFGLADKTASSAASVGWHFHMLLDAALKAIVTKSRVLAMPTLVYSKILQEWGPSMLGGLKVEEATSVEDDLGWMYKALNDEPLPDFDAHLIWPSDSF